MLSNLHRPLYISSLVYPTDTLSPSHALFMLPPHISFGLSPAHKSITSHRPPTAVLRAFLVSFSLQCYPAKWCLPCSFCSHMSNPSARPLLNDIQLSVSYFSMRSATLLCISELVYTPKSGVGLMHRQQSSTYPCCGSL